MILMSPSPPDSSPASAAATLPEPLAAAVKGVITFLSYEDLPAAVSFYRELAGLRIAEDFGWCCLLELQPCTYLGLIDATAGSQRPVVGANKGVLVSLEVADLATCLERARRLGLVAADTRLVPGCRGRTREFRIVDPGGYSVEFFSWVPPTTA